VLLYCRGIDYYIIEINQTHVEIESVRGQVYYVLKFQSGVAKAKRESAEAVGSSLTMNVVLSAYFMSMGTW